MELWLRGDPNSAPFIVIDSLDMQRALNLVDEKEPAGPATEATMNVKQLRNFCKTMPFASERLLADPANILVFSLDDKNFAYFKTSQPERWRFSIKVMPGRFVELTGIPGVKPARYRGRYHWITIVDVRRFPATYLRELVEWSHRHAFESLRVSRRKALLAQEAYLAIDNSRNITDTSLSSKSWLQPR